MVAVIYPTTQHFKSTIQIKKPYNQSHHQQLDSTYGGVTAMDVKAERQAETVLTVRPRPRPQRGNERGKWDRKKRKKSATITQTSIVCSRVGNDLAYFLDVIVTIMHIRLSAQQCLQHLYINKKYYWLCQDSCRFFFLIQDFLVFFYFQIELSSSHLLACNSLIA